MQRVLGVTTMMLLSACATTEPAPNETVPVVFGAPIANFLSDDLLQVLVPVEEGLPTAQEARDVTDCAVAASALERDLQFARHVRTSLTDPEPVTDDSGVEAGIRTVDAVYTLSEAVPRGDFVIDVAVQAETCNALEEEGANG